MKRKIIAVAAILATGSVLATAGHNPVTVSGTGTNTINSSTAAGSFVNGAGTSLSRASNTQTASAYVGGSGSLSSKQGNAIVSVADCEAPRSIHGIQTNGNVLSFGGTLATGRSVSSNVSTGAGTGGAQAVGSSIVEVKGKTLLTSPNMNLSAEGTAFSGVVTNTGVVGTNGSGSSNGSTSSVFRAGAKGVLFTYDYKGVSGDTKAITSNSFTRVGGIPVVTTSCGNTNCVTGPSISNNAIVEGGATANAGGSVVATIKRP